MVSLFVFRAGSTSRKQFFTGNMVRMAARAHNLLKNSVSLRHCRSGTGLVFSRGGEHARAKTVFHGEHAEEGIPTNPLDAHRSNECSPFSTQNHRQISSVCYPHHHPTESDRQCSHVRTVPSFSSTLWKVKKINGNRQSIVGSVRGGPPFSWTPYRNRRAN